jgi:hypothetical protein
MAREGLDLILHLGDYIYEGAARDGFVRRHNSGELFTLEDYRNRYALYKADAALQAAHAAAPWLVTWDDHEVDNNYANLIPAGELRRGILRSRNGGPMPTRPTTNTCRCGALHCPMVRTCNSTGSFGSGSWRSSSFWTRGNIGPISLVATV